MKPELPIVVLNYAIIIDAERIGDEVELVEVLKKRMREGHYDFENNNESLILFIANSCDITRRNGFTKLSIVANADNFDPSKILFRELKFGTLSDLKEFCEDWDKVVKEDDGIFIWLWIVKIGIPFCKTIPVYEGYGIDWWEESFTLRSENTTNPKLQTTYRLCHDITKIARQTQAVNYIGIAPPTEDNSMNLELKFVFENLANLTEFVERIDSMK